MEPYRKVDASLDLKEKVQWHSLPNVLPALQKAHAQGKASISPEPGAVSAVFLVCGQQQVLVNWQNTQL
jgi:hypothetical protein